MTVPYKSVNTREWPWMAIYGRNGQRIGGMSTYFDPFYTSKINT